jgi:broad specificity phosphatase PhoE
MLPIDLIFIRHGESEGNIAMKASKSGDNSLFTPEFRDRHSREFRLTDRGIEQAEIAGEWLRKNTTFTFDRHYVSDYIRAKETAVHLRLPDALWRVEFQLRERDKGVMDNLPLDEQSKLFEREQRQYELDPFLSFPAGGGESIASLCLRLKADFLSHLARDCSDMKIAAVCHGHVMRALQLELLQLGHDDFLRLDASDDPQDKIRNCQIMWYTRRDPENGRNTGSRLYAFRSVTPSTGIDSGWKRIARVLRTNDDLLLDVESYPRHAN